MNWYAVPNQGVGIEFHLLALAICIAIMIKESGALSVDGMLSKD